MTDVTLVPAAQIVHIPSSTWRSLRAERDHWREQALRRVMPGKSKLDPGLARLLAAEIFAQEEVRRMVDELARRWPADLFIEEQDGWC